MTTHLAPEPENVDQWDRTVYAFLAEKESRSGSKRTVESYSRILRLFFTGLSKTPDQVETTDVFSFAHGIGPSGRDPSAATISARIGCVSSFYRFLIRMELVTSNPCDRLQRPKTVQPVPRGLSADEVRRLVAAIPDSPTGIRDRAIVLTLVLTGRRRAEVLGLTAGDIEQGNPAYYKYRGKGGKRGRRELPRPAFNAIERFLSSMDLILDGMPPADSIWPNRLTGRGIASGTFYTNFRRYLRKANLPLSGVHILRHTAAKLRRDAGEPVEQVSQFLDHSSLAVTTTYLRRLEGQEDHGWDRVASAIGVSIE